MQEPTKIVEDLLKQQQQNQDQNQNENGDDGEQSDSQDNGQQQSGDQKIRKVQMSRMVSKTIMRVNSLTKAKLTMNSKVAEITHNSLMIPR